MTEASSESGLEAHHEAETYTILLRIGMAVVIETVNKVDCKELEYIMYTRYEFHVRCFRIHHMRTLREAEQHIIAIILRKERVILICQLAEHTLESHIFTPLELLNKRNTVKKFAV